MWVREIATFLGAMAASLLPVRLWQRLPSSFSMVPAAFACGLAMLFLGAAIGIPGFLEHAHANASVALDKAVEHMYKSEVYRGDLVIGYSGLSIFTFLLLTPKGWLTMYLLSTGTVRAIAAWFDDPLGDPVLTIGDALLFRRRLAWRLHSARVSREALEGPEVADRLVSSSAAGIPGCDFVIVASRRKPGWERGAAVYTADGCYRIGEPVEQTIAGRLRTLYPLTEHNDFEAIRKAVRYDLPGPRVAAAVEEPHRRSGD